MNELSTHTGNAIAYAKSAEQFKALAVINAAKCGAELVTIKALLAHGEFESWIEEHMPINVRQCQKYMQLAKGRPDLLDSKNVPGALLDVNTETLLLTFAQLFGEDAAKEVREVAIDENLNRKEIKELVDQLKNKDREIKEWRQQYLDQRNLARQSRQALDKQEPVYIVDNDKATEQYREETEDKITQLQALIKTTQDELGQAQQAMGSEENYQAEIERLQKQETSLHASIALLKGEHDVLDNTIGIHKDHLERQKKYLDFLERMTIQADIILDDDFSDENREIWLELFHKTEAMVSSFKQMLGKTERVIA